MNIPTLLIPLLAPLFSAVFCLFFWNRPQVQKWIFFLGASLMLYGAFKLLNQVWYGGMYTLQAGSWPAPFGITLVADMLSAGMVLMVALSGFLIFLYSLASLDPYRVKFGFYPVLLFLMFGLCGALLAGDVFNLYVWFEIMLVSCFVLLTLGGTREQLEGAVKYVVINFISSAIFLTGIGIIYGLTGALNMADVALRMREIPDQGLASVAAVFFIVCFGIKSAIFPLFFWLPPAYHTPPIPITAMVAGLLSKVGVYAMIRFFTLIFVQNQDYTHTILLWAAGLSMVIGALGAIAQNDVRKILSFSIVSQIGYLIMGLAFFTPLAMAGVVYFLFHSILVKTNLFLVSGLLRFTNGSYLLRHLGGAYDRYPFIALLFAITAFSLTGVPPLSGFWGKFMLVKAGFETGQFVLVGVALVASVFTLVYVTKIWLEAFWKNDPRPEQKVPGDGGHVVVSQSALLSSKLLLVIPVVVLTGIILMLGVYAEPILAFSFRAADQLMNPDEYIRAVLQ
jgi:multicomponent Na+:H+ antiporter subunit D